MVISFYKTIKILVVFSNGFSKTDQGVGQSKNFCKGAIQVLRNGGVSFSGKWHYEGVRFSVTKGWVGVKFPGKKCYVTLEWPQNASFSLPMIIHFIVLINHISEEFFDSG